MTTPFTSMELHFAGETFKKYGLGIWESNLKVVLTYEDPAGMWSSFVLDPQRTFEGITSRVEGYLYEDAALRAAITRYYEIQVKICEAELHRNKKILFEARGN